MKNKALLCSLVITGSATFANPPITHPSVRQLVELKPAIKALSSNLNNQGLTSHRGQESAFEAIERIITDFVNATEDAESDAFLTYIEDTEELKTSLEAHHITHDVYMAQKTDVLLELFSNLYLLRTQALR